MHELPQHLLGTATMLRAAFPDGIPPDKKLAVMRALYDWMSDRNLADVVATLTGSDPGLLYNDVLTCAALAPDSPPVNAVVAQLKMHGYDHWVARIDLPDSR